MVGQGELFTSAAAEIEMRKMMMGTATVLVLAVSAPQVAYCLTRNDTMTDWLDASDADRLRVLDDIQAETNKSGQVSRPKVIECMNAAAEVSGHRALHIGDVAEACSEPQSPADGKAPTDT